MSRRLVYVFCHSALLLCMENKMQTVCEERGEGGNENVSCRRKLLNGTNCPGGVFVCPCAACLLRSIIRKDKPAQEAWAPCVPGHSGPLLPAHSNGVLALNCQFTGITVIQLLSVTDPEIAQHGSASPSNPADSLASTQLRG